MLADGLALKPRQGPNDTKDERAATGRRVDLVEEPPISDSTFSEDDRQFGRDGERAAQLVESPDDQGIAGAAEVERFGDALPLHVGATPRVGEDSPAPSGCLRLMRRA